MADKSLPSLVIVGASVGGGFLVRQLISSGEWHKFNTTVIDKNDFLEWFINSDRYLSDSSLIDQHLLSITTYFEKNKLDQFNIKFVQG